VPDDELQALAAAADEITGDEAERCQELFEQAGRLSERSGLPVEAHYTPIDLTHARRITLSDGSSAWVEWNPERS
jgi:hypothetical protein